MSRRARFRDRLEKAKKVHIDTPVIAYHMIANPGVVELTRLVFEGLRDERVSGQTSVLSIYELLTEPYRRGRAELAERAVKLLRGHAGLQIIPVSLGIARQAAEVQASLGGSGGRAVQLATALAGSADTYLTDRTALRRVAGIDVITLDDYRTP